MWFWFLTAALVLLPAGFYFYLKRRKTSLMAQLLVTIINGLLAAPLSGSKSKGIPSVRGNILIIPLDNERFAYIPYYPAKVAKMINFVFEIGDDEDNLKPLGNPHPAIPLIVSPKMFGAKMIRATNLNTGDVITFTGNAIVQL